MKRVKEFVLVSLILSCGFSCFSFDKKEQETQQEPSKEVLSELPEKAIPITYRKHIYINGMIDNISGIYIYDTGADQLYIDSTFYSLNNFHYPNLRKAVLKGIGTSYQQINCIVDTVSFSFYNNTYHTTFTPIIQLKSIMGDYSDGIIGNDYFRPYIVELNYEKEYLLLHSQMDSINTEEYTKIPMVVNSQVRGRFLIPLTIKVNSTVSISGNFLLDLGSGGSISLTSSETRKQSLTKNITPKREYYTKYGGIGGNSRSFDFWAESLQIGGYEFNDVYMDFCTDKSGALSNSNYCGLIGNGILEHFDILIDYQNQDLYIKPNANFGKEFKSSRLSFSFVDRSQTLGAWIVSGLYKDCPAEQAGLKINDKILTVNGTHISQIPYQKQASFFNAKDEITLGIIRESEELQITFPLTPIL